MTDVVTLFSMPARLLDFRIDTDVAARALIQRLDKFQFLFQRHDFERAFTVWKSTSQRKAKQTCRS